MAYKYGTAGYDVNFIPEQEIKTPNANAKIDAAIRKGKTPGVLAIDPKTGMATGVKTPMQSPAQGGKLGSLGKAWTVVSMANALADSAANDSTARYAQRFGVSEPTGDGSMGDMAKFAALRMGGFASDLGNNMLGGVPGKLFYRDQQAGASIIPEAAASELPRPANVITPTAPATRQPAAVAQPQPAGAISNPATIEQQQAIGAMGITTDRVVNQGAGVDYATANQIEKQGRYGGKEGMFTQLTGYGDQNSLYGRASRPGGKINEFYGAGTGKAYNPASMGLNIIPSAAMMQPETRGPGLGERAAIMERNIADAEARGDGRAANGMRAELDALYGDRKQAANPLQQQLAQVMAMPDNTFGNRASKRAALAALSRGIQIQDMESRNALEREKAGSIAQEIAQRIETSRLTLAEQKRASNLRDQILGATDPVKLTDLTRKLNSITGAKPESTSSSYKVEMNEVAQAFSTPATDSKGKPIIDLMTGRQVVNRDQAKEREFMQWMAKNNITDTNKGLALYLGGGAQQPSASGYDSYVNAFNKAKAAGNKQAMQELTNAARSAGIVK